MGRHVPPTRPSTEDLGFFFDTSHAALASRLGPAVEILEDEHDEGAVVDALRGPLNLFGLVVPDGPAVDVRALCLAREALAYISPLADSIFAVQGLGVHPLLLAGTPEQRARYVDRARTGDDVAAFALTESEAGSDVAALATRATPIDGGYRLDGEKVFISNAGLARFYTVFANADPSAGKRGITAFVVPADTPGLTVSRLEAGADHPLGRLVFRDCHLPSEARIGEVGQGLKLALATLDTFRVSVGAAACGMARRALAETLLQVRTRKQFGEALGQFQMTRARVAEMATSLDASRLLVYRAAWQKDTTRERGSTAVAMAKLFATEAAQRIIDDAVQLFGGRGVMRGAVVERLYREIRPLRIYEGTSEIQRLIISQALLAEGT